MLKFQNKVVLVTGSGTGIGQAIAKKFAENGASIIILGRRKEPLDQTAKILEEIFNKVQSKAFVKIFSGVDVSDEQLITDMFESLKKSNINVDVIVNNAGVSGPVTCFPNSPLDEFKSAVAIHLTGTFWTSSQALRVMKSGSKIITISTFFAEERPLEQRPYRFRSPYTASQGAKNRLAEAMSWELTDKGIISIATNPGPVHSDRIYKTVYPKAASEFMRVSGFEDLSPLEVEQANKEIVPLLGEDDSVVKKGISQAAANLAKTKAGADSKKLEETLAKLLSKIQSIAEKIQKNTAKMIADEQFLSQEQVAQTILALCDDNIAKILNGKVIPGDRVFYPVRPHIATTTPDVAQPDFSSKVFVFTVDATDKSDSDRVEYISEHIVKNGGKVVCLISKNSPKECQDSLKSKFHSHVIDLKNPAEVERFLNTAKGMGILDMVIHVTGKVPNFAKMLELSRKDWDSLVDKFVNTPATVLQKAFDIFVPGGAKDPRLFKGKIGAAVVIGPDLPVGDKVSGAERAKVEVFRGALRPFATTVNQELSDVLSSKVRSFLILPGTIDGKKADDEKICQAINYFSSDNAASLSEVIFCTDEVR
ncbi:MAG: SDR family NAD(P)-dependent oxidoreductase [Thaumarchaeota archaeon]|nr:SDR family NAD(P)-dependent oxidoreductase [Nitrososphaerota archaeon]